TATTQIYTLSLHDALPISIMYIAAITSIDQEIYEAAKVDGAGRFRLMWHVTVPGVMPTFFVLLLLAIGNFINNGMEQFYVFQNRSEEHTSELQSRENLVCR